MKKFTLLFTMMLCAICASAATVTDVLTAENMGLTKQYTDRTHNFGGREYISNAYKSGNGGIQMRANSNSGIITTKSNGLVRSVTIDVESGTNQFDVYGSNIAYTAIANIYGTGTSTKGTLLGSLTESGTITVEGDYKYVAIRSKSGAIYATSISIEWEEQAATQCEQPTFTPASGETIWCKEGEETEIALNCSTEGAEIRYYVYGNDTDISTISDEDYAYYDSESKVIINSTNNKIAAYATHSTLEKSEKAYGTWEITNYVTVTDIQDFITKGTETPNDYYEFDGYTLYVTAQNGKYTYVRDYSGNALLIYGNLTYNGSAISSLSNGQRIPGIAGNYAKYNGANELTNPRILGEVSESDINTQYTKPLIKSIADITTDDICQYVRINFAKINTTDQKIEVGENSLAYYLGRFNASIPTEGVNTDLCVVEGIIESYNGNLQLSITSICELPEECTATAGYSTNATLTKQDGSAKYTGTMQIKRDEVFKISDAYGNEWFINDDNYLKLGTACQLSTNPESEKSFLWGGNYTVTYNAVDNTVTFESDDAYPAQLRIITNDEGKDYYNYNDKKFIAEKKEGTVGTYEFTNVDFFSPGKFYITAETSSTLVDEIENWAIGAADTENGNNVLASNGTVNLFPHTTGNNIDSYPIQIKTEENGYVKATYNVTVDLANLTVSSIILTGIDEIEAEGAEIEVGEGNISVAGGKATIYNAAGQTIATASNSQVAVPAGLYIVKVNGKATKVIVK